MVCERVRIGGTTAIVCSRRTRRRKCQACGKANSATRECDWKVPSRKSGTCDLLLCDRCAFSPAPDKDLCPDHADLFHDWLRERRHKKGGEAEAPPRDR